MAKKLRDQWREEWYGKLAKLGLNPEDERQYTDAVYEKWLAERRIHKRIDGALTIEAEAAKDADAVGYMARALVQATLPHSKQTESVFVRENGNFSMAIMAHPKIGLPYGALPRLLMSYLTTEAVRTKSRDIELGGSLTEFMAHLGEDDPTGGRTGSIPRVKEQTMRLFSSSISCTYTADDRMGGINMALADSYELWWNPKQPDQQSLFTSSVRLGERFYQEVTERPVPVDLRVLRELKKSPMQLDIYTWLTYRMSYLTHPVTIPWSALERQFGAEYGRRYDFVTNFVKQLQNVLVVYSKPKVDATSAGLRLIAGSSHVPKVRAPKVPKLSQK